MNATTQTINARMAATERRNTVSDLMTGAQAAMP